MIETRLAYSGILACALLGTTFWKAQAPRPKKKPAPVQAAPVLPLATFDHPGVQGCTVTPDGRRAITWGKDGKVKVWALPEEATRLPVVGCTLPVPAGPASWSPTQACGAPDTMTAGDIRTSWAPRSPDSGNEWLQLAYAKPMRAHRVRVHETYNPGAITQVELLGKGNQLLSRVPVTRGSQPAPSFLELDFEETGEPVHAVRLVLDTRKVPGWNEIDAVELVGKEGGQWAAKATASSSYGAGF